ncbi:MAG TPA: glycosyltransferase family 39 protein [Bryobacteraceae bacterium]|nr:glycosyltransferase family 39 protein [Bryobacteraceae bacterium]
MNRNPKTRLAPAMSVLLFFITGLALIPYPGLQNDELFFSGPIYAPDSAFFSLKAGAVKIPLMVMSYSGALKTWLYAGLFEVFEANKWSVRIPALLMGMGTIWLTWRWVERIAGRRAAIVTVVLLSTDTIFLMTNTFDWGPVALQHLLLLGGLVAIQGWLGNGNRGLLALGFFLWGLGTWDKALLAWPLIGLATATACVYPREALARFRPRNVAVAALAFLLGAAPLVGYNIKRHGETAKANARFTTEDFRNKVAALRITVDGSTLFDYMVYGNGAPGRRAPQTWIGRASAAIYGVVGEHRKNWMVPAYVAAFAGFVLFLARSRMLWFLLIATAVAWLQMALTKGTGGASHHVILLWPFPVVFLGIVLARLSERLPVKIPAIGRDAGVLLLSVVVAFLAVENLLTTNEYLEEFTANGGAGGWTDAIYPLADSVDAKPASWIGMVDWGILNGLRLLHEGELPLFVVEPDADAAGIRRQIDDPKRLFIQHTDDKQIFPGINERFRNAALREGFAERVVKTVPDRNGRPVFEIISFERVNR